MGGTDGGAEKGDAGWGGRIVGGAGGGGRVEREREGR